MYNTNIPTRVELPSSKQLVRSTLLAVIAAIVLLVTTVLPAEYGIDPTGAGKLLGLTRMGSIKIELAEGAKSDQPSVETSQLAKVGPSLIARVKSAPPALNKNELTIMLRPGQAAEVKLSMAKDASVSYQWQADGPVNFDAHGDPVKRTKGFYHGYGKGRGVKGDNGKLLAAFDGTHGWFWRNRTNKDVTLRLNTEGEYDSIKRVL